MPPLYREDDFGSDDRQMNRTVVMESNAYGRKPDPGGLSQSNR